MSDTTDHRTFPEVTTSDLSRTPARLHGRFEFVDLIRSIENIAVRGLVKKTNSGWELTGRGMVLKETLMLDIVDE
jgi:hypothetical protein